MLSVVKGKMVGDGPQEVDDRQLALQARDGDEDAFSKLVKRHSGGLHRAVSRVLCDDTEAWDVVQMAFLKAWQRLDRYNPKWSFATWAYRIGTNLAIDVIRARKSRNRAHQSGAEHRLRLVGTYEPTSAQAARGDADRVLSRVLPALSTQQRAAFVLREVEGLETSEVAKVLGCSPTTVRNHVFQARKTLKVEIAKHFPEYLPASRRS